MAKSIEQIERITMLLKVAWVYNKDLRFMQLMEAITHLSKEDTFYLKDGDLEQKIREHLRVNNVPAVEFEKAVAPIKHATEEVKDVEMQEAPKVQSIQTAAREVRNVSADVSKQAVESESKYAEDDEHGRYRM